MYQLNLVWVFRARARQSWSPSSAAGVARDGKDGENAPTEAIGCIIDGAQEAKMEILVYTAKHCQLVVMALKPKQEIGAEVHKLDQFFRVEEGSGEAVLDSVRTAIRAGFAVVVPAGTNHNIINTGSVPLKLYTLYAPPNHRDGVVNY